MKKLLLLLFVLPLMSMGQTEIPNESNKIIVHTSAPASAADNFLKVKKALVDLDIQIASQDKDLFQIGTGKILYSDDIYSTYLISCKDQLITITGQYTDRTITMGGGFGAGTTTRPVLYKGRGKKIFLEMNAFAKKLGAELTYDKVLPN